MSNNTQLPAEWVIKIDKEAQERYPYSIQATERAAYKSVAREYATKLHQAQQENEQLKRWKAEASELLNPILDYGQSKEAGIQVGKSITNTVLERCKQFAAARALLEKVIYRHEGGLLPDRLLYNEIKTFLDGK